MRGVVRDTWLAAVKPWEGRESGMYPDTHDPPLITTGMGNLIDPVERALPLPWLRKADDQPATEDEVRAEWQRMHDDRHRLSVAGAHAARKMATLYLTDEAIDALVCQVRDEMWATLVRMFPRVEEAPAPAQRGLLLMIWALGGGEMRREFPHFCAAVLNGDWAMAAAECKIKNAHAARNAEHKRLFELAAAVGDPDALSGEEAAA